MQHINEILKQNNLNMKVTSYIEETSLDTIINFLIDDINIKILTDFNNYCLGESLNENIKYFNINIIFIEKTINNIINELYNTFKKKSIFKYENNFNININYEELTKEKINYNLIKENLIKYYNTNNLTDILNTNEIIFNKTQIITIIINELKKFNRNMDYKHYITINYEESNIFIIRYIFNKELSSKIKKVFDYDYIELKLNIAYYPYLPPKLEYIKPPIKNDLYIGLLDLKILNILNWNSIISIEYLLINLGNELEKIIDDYILYNLEDYNNLENELLKLSYFLKYCSNKINININFINFETIDNKKNFWNAGTGYSNKSSTNKWNIKNYIKDQELTNTQIYNSLLKINELLNNDNIDILLSSYFKEYINNTIRELTFLELNKNKNIYIILFDIIEKILEKNKEIYFKNIENLYNEISGIDILNNIELNYINKIIKICKILSDNNIIKNDNNIINTTNYKELYINTMKTLQYDTYEIETTHSFYNMINRKPTKKAFVRILSELGSFKTSLPLNWCSSIWVRISKQNLSIFSFLISGPENTPYENGLFEFHAYFSEDYPKEVPRVLLKTTGNNTVRFNPNLYKCGKVCLSLLGTFNGLFASEKWIPETSTFIQIMVSIQSLILIDDPYYNEPGSEKALNTDIGKSNSLKYNLTLYPNTIKYGMIDMILNPPKGFETIVKEHFKYKKEEIIDKITKWETYYTNNILKDDKIKLINLLNNI